MFMVNKKNTKHLWCQFNYVRVGVYFNLTEKPPINFESYTKRLGGFIQIKIRLEDVQCQVI